MPKGKKKLNKKIKRKVKKIIRKTIAKQTLPGIDDQVKRNEMLKVMLARQPQSIMATDPEYRSLLQKNQQLNEQVNLKEFYLNNLKNQNDALNLRKDQQAKTEQEILKMNREAKLQRDLNKTDAALAAKREQAGYDLNRQKRLNDIGKMDMEIQQIDYETRRMNREKQAMEDEIRGNKTYQELQLKKQDFEQLRAQSEALKSVMNDKTFKDPNPLLIVQLRDIEKERLKIENQRRIMEKHRQLKAEQEEWRAKKDALTLMEQPHKQKYTYWDGKQNVIVEETISDTARYQKQLQAYDKDNERLKLAKKNTMNELNRIEGTIDEISKKRAENEKLRYDNDFMKNYLQQREAEVLTPEFKQHMSEIAGEKVKLEREREIQQHMEDIHKIRRQNEFNVATFNAYQEIPAREANYDTIAQYTQQMQELAEGYLKDVKQINVKKYAFNKMAADTMNAIGYNSQRSFLDWLTEISHHKGWGYDFNDVNILTDDQLDKGMSLMRRLQNHRGIGENQDIMNAFLESEEFTSL